ncbi:MAG: peptidoglycan recognition protein family protein [Clostridium chrysemydis]|uniref:peptidoglycan recognition protein family protein n=1 Tax=Clostridium chrysemydis TaxID=2665504 RepID=UPI003F3349F9
MNITRQLSRFNHYEGGNSKDYIIIHSTGNTNDTAKNNADYFGRADRGASAHYFVDDNSIYQVVEDNDCSWSCGDGHNKYGIGNRNTIAIEMCGTDDGNISDKTIENTLELTKSLMNKYGINIDHVVRHYDASRKCCPSQFSPNDWKRWWNFKARLEGKDVENIEIKPSEPLKTQGDKLWEVSISGEEVKKLQHQLNIQGYGDIKEDGYFGDSTLSVCPTVREGAEGNITKCIQQRLLNRGYTSLKSSGGADGVFGRGTTIAIENLQRNKNLTVDGIVGKNTWKALYKVI